MILLLGVALIR